MWFNKISIQFAQPNSKLCILSQPLFLLASVSSSYFNFNLSVSRSPILCCCLSCPLATVCHRFPSSSFFSASAYKLKTLPPHLLRRWKWRESGKGVITMSIHKHRTPRDCMDESTSATGKLPTQPGQVICDTVENHNKHSDKAKGTNWR